MNKKLIGNLFLLALVITLGLSFIDFGKSEKSHEEVISEYIINNLEERTEYQPIRIKRIDENMLLSQPTIGEAFATITDSIAQQLNLLADVYSTYEVKAQWQAAHDHLQRLNLESISSYLPLDARLKRALKRSTIDEQLQAALYEEESRMHSAINDLNNALGRFNLSVFSLDLSEDANPRYWHEYRLTNDSGSSAYSAVFELAKDDHEILSFNII